MIYVFLANGFEDMEAIVPIDCLRRAKLEVQTAGVGGKEITSSHGITVKTDIKEDEVILDKYVDLIVLPGGMPGTLNLDNSEAVHKAIDFCIERGKYIGAICAAPSILGKRGLLEGQKATCFEGFESQLAGAKITNLPVVVSDKFITARGAGVALEFAMTLVETLTSKETAKSLKKKMLCAR